jgi:carnitine-CoA ligase
VRSELKGTFLPGRRAGGGSLVDVLLDAEARNPDGDHLRWPGGGSMSVAAFADRVRRWAALLRANGAGRGDRVALVCTNTADFLALQFGTYMVGAVEVPINCELRGDMLRSVLADADPALVVIDEEVAEHVAEHVPSGVAALVLDEHLRSEAARTDPLADVVCPSPGDLAFILYTSGTTGPSKGVMLPHGYLPNTAATWIAALGVTSEDASYFSAPCFHVDGHVMNTMCLLSGATFGFTKRFSVTRFWDEAAAMGATLFLAVGSMASALRNRRPDHPPRHSFRIGVVAPIQPEVYDYFEGELGIPLLQLYGQTEADGVTFCTPERSRRGSAGWACCGFDVRIVGDDDQPVPVGERGRLIYRPHEPHMMTLGYWNRPEATVLATRNLWWHTGDLARVDEDGFVYFEGRDSDSLRRRGENISAWELESAIAGADGVKTAIAVAVEDELGGEDEIKVFLVLDERTQWDSARFFAYCEQSLPRFARPRFVELITEEALVRSAGTGAVQKHLLPKENTEHTIDYLEVRTCPLRS